MSLSASRGRWLHIVTYDRWGWLQDDLSLVYWHSSLCESTRKKLLLLAANSKLRGDPKLSLAAL